MHLYVYISLKIRIFIEFDSNTLTFILIFSSLFFSQLGIEKPVVVVSPNINQVSTSSSTQNGFILTTNSSSQRSLSTSSSLDSIERNPLQHHHSLNLNSTSCAPSTPTEEEQEHGQESFQFIYTGEDEHDNTEYLLMEEEVFNKVRCITHCIKN